MAGVAVGGEAQSTATVTVLFCDLVGSTERQTRMGDDAADHFRRVFFAALTDAVSSTRGEVVKNTGDGLMVVFRSSVVDAVTCASTMHDNAESLDVDEPAFVRVGVSAGEAAIEHGDWFGTPVVEAARLCAAADAGQTLVSEIVRALVGSRGGHQFRSVGTLSLKGLPGPVPAAAVIRTPIAAPRAEPRSRRRKPWPMAIAAGLVVVLIAAVVVVLTRDDSKTTATVPRTRDYTPRFERKPCPTDFAKQVPNGTCGDLVVPENRTKPKGRWIRLPITRAPARPGASSGPPTIAIGSFEDTTRTPSRDFGELIAFQSRTDGDRNAPRCPEFDSVAARLLARGQADLAVIADGQKALRACYDRVERSGMTLAHYNVDDAGRDVVDLISALHLREVNLVAGEAWSQLAYVVMRVAPDAVRTLTLENPETPHTGTWSDPTAQLGEAFDQYISLCRDNPRCRRAFPDLLTLAHGTWKQFKDHPRVVDVSVYGNKARVLLDGDRTAKTLATALLNREAYPLIAAGIAHPQVDLDATLAAQLDGYFLQPGFSWSVALSDWCSHDLYTIFVGHKLSSRTRPELAGIDDGFLEWACKAWPVPKAPDETFVDVASPVPTLIMVGLLHPFESPDFTATLVSGLPRASIVTFPTLGAGILREGIPSCVNDLRRQFLKNPQQHLDTATCAKGSPPITFVAGGG
jgi:class 3 adenylate cyclase